MKIAKIYISFLENKKTVDELMLALRDKKNLIRHYVGMELKLKYGIYDDRFELHQSS